MPRIIAIMVAAIAITLICLGAYFQGGSGVETVFRGQKAPASPRSQLRLEEPIDSETVEATSALEIPKAVIRLPRINPQLDGVVKQSRWLEVEGADPSKQTQLVVWQSPLGEEIRRDAEELLPSKLVTPDEAKDETLSIELILGELAAVRLSGGFGQTFRVIRVEPKSNPVCEIILSNASNVRLIGTKVGRTELLIVARQGNVSDPSSTKLFKVTVTVLPLGAGTFVDRNLAAVSRAVDHLYPACDVEFRAEDGQVIAKGQCDTESNARRILSLARRACLLPVQDDVEVPQRIVPASAVAAVPTNTPGHHGMLDPAGTSAFPLIECAPHEILHVSPFPIRHNWMIETSP